MEGVGEVLCTSPQPSTAAESSYPYQFLDRENYWRESEEEKSSAIEDFLKELDVEGHELIKKFVEENVPLEQVLRETWHHFRGKAAASHLLEKIARRLDGEREEGFVMRERGVDLEEELKNERFKVKTMNVAGSGVVEEDNGK